jgi:hypothetical protein
MSIGSGVQRFHNTGSKKEINVIRVAIPIASIHLVTLFVTFEQRHENKLEFVLKKKREDER